VEKVTDIRDLVVNRVDYKTLSIRRDGKYEQLYGSAKIAANL